MLVDVRRLLHARASLEYLDRYRVPHLLMVNEFNRAQQHSPGRIRATLSVGPAVPVVYGDARQRDEARGVLARLVEHSLGMPGPRPWDR